MKVVVLDSFALQDGDLNWQPLYNICDDVITYPRTKYEQAAGRIADAECVIVNKCKIDEGILSCCPNLKWVGITATGTDIVDLVACKKRNILVSNVPGYSTQSVAQLTFALLLSICQCPERFNNALKCGYWQTDIPDSFEIMPQQELFGKTIGIVGYGEIAKAVIGISKAFGMNVACHTRTVPQEKHDINFTTLPDLAQQSDIISLHCPLTEQTKHIINADVLTRCKKNAIIINTARGLLVNENDIIDALNSNKILAYGCDAYSQEPLQKHSKLLSTKNVFATPHIAWTTTQALAKLSKCVCENLKSFVEGNPKNIVA